MRILPTEGKGIPIPVILQKQSDREIMERCYAITRKEINMRKGAVVWLLSVNLDVVIGLVQVYSQMYPNDTSVEVKFLHDAEDTDSKRAYARGYITKVSPGRLKEISP